MNVILENVLAEKAMAALAEDLRSGAFPALVNGVCDNALPAVACALCERLSKKALFVTPDEKSAQELKRRLEAYVERALVFPARTVLYDTVESSSREWEQSRIDVLNRMANGLWDAVIAVPDAAMQYTLPIERLREYSILIEAKGSYDMKLLCDKLLLLGYKRADFVEGVGQFSVRGGILDVFSPGSERPVRVDFFGDEVDKTAYFDIITQRRTAEVERVLILPSSENVYGVDGALRVSEYVNAKLHKAKGLSQQALNALLRERDALENSNAVLCPDKYRSLLFEKNATLADYAGDALIFVTDGKRVGERARAYWWEMSKQAEDLTDRGLSDFDMARCCVSDLQFSLMTEKRRVVFEAFYKAAESGVYKSYANIVTKRNGAVGNNLSVLAEELKALTEARYRVLYIASNSVSAANALSLLCDKGISAFRFGEELEDGSVAVATPFGGTVGGFELPGSAFSVIAEEAPAPRKASVRSVPAALKGERISSYADLAVGDYVVHVNHGIGVFRGIQKLVTEGVAKDFIKIAYAGSDSLYVPAERLDFISKYVGNTEKVKLSRLGGTEWYRAKQRVKASARNIAKELLQLYGERKRGIATPCVADDELQQEFEATFEYPETTGQLAAAKEIKADMERSVPMERLLCGDVGFGKTEVALRAAFKAVNSGMQAALLVPTTILAWQHFQTMKARFRGFPVKVGMLSSFNDRRANEATVSELKQGRLDIVVGTHRLLQKDVGFSSLGLLIVDEEQRFGVTHKERLKRLAKSVHTLTLSATPIPRTLNMALSGIRDMSVLEDAPADRFPVQSYVLEYDEDIVYNAIERELRRGGQVFYLHNSIDSLYSAAAALSKRFPERVVAAAHGRMEKKDLSEIWASMVRGEIDILVCTTIIEAGTDVPNANTLIVEDADRLGLSQLHQIRGRVGRSSRRAYAYFTYRSGKMLTEIAEKRLRAIREYTEFGSGFKIALRDLEIRGAGNLLGAEQHGHIESVGYDLYVKLLKEAVDEEKGVVTAKTPDCAVDLRVNAFIPEGYIVSPAVRIDIYKKIAFVSDDAERDDLRDELTDRFGALPAEVESLISISMLRHRAAALGFSAVEQNEELLSLYSDALDTKAAVAVSASPGFKGRILISAGAHPHIACRAGAGAAVLPVLASLLEIYGRFRESTQKNAREDIREDIREDTREDI